MSSHGEPRVYYYLDKSKGVSLTDFKAFVGHDRGTDRFLWAFEVEEVNL